MAQKVLSALCNLFPCRHVNPRAAVGLDAAGHPPAAPSAQDQAIRGWIGQMDSQTHRVLARAPDLTFTPHAMQIECFTNVSHLRPLPMKLATASHSHESVTPHCMVIGVLSVSQAPKCKLLTGTHTVHLLRAHDDKGKICDA